MEKIKVYCSCILYVIGAFFVGIFVVRVMMK